MVRRLLLALPLALACAALWPSASQAFVGCSYSAGTLNVFMNRSEDAARVVRGGDAINVVVGGGFSGGPEILVGCSGGTATITNTDQIVVDSAATARFAAIGFDLSGGAFAPGATPEPDGSSEIELRTNMFGREDFVSVLGTGAGEVFHLGRLPSGAAGMNLNPGAELTPDVDLEMASVELVALTMGRGSDVIRMRGAPGFAGPLGGRVVVFADGGRGPDELIAGRASVLMSGSEGRDRIFGSSHGDALIGGPARDVIKSGKGNDEVFAAGGGRDRVNCGAGRDTAGLDDGDGGRGCEKRNHASGRGIGFIIRIIAGGFDAQPLSTAANILRGK